MEVYQDTDVRGARLRLRELRRETKEGPGAGETLSFQSVDCAARV